MEKAKKLFRSPALRTALFVFVLTFIVGAVVYAASGGGDDGVFADLVTKLKDWSQGGLGKTFALAALLVGLGLGIVRQSVMGAATGFGVAAASYYGPGVLDGVFTATMGSVIHASHSILPQILSWF